MHVGFIVYGSLETVSGGHLYDKQVVNYLREKGDDVEVISLPSRNYSDCLQDNFSAELSNRLVPARYDILLQDELNHPSLFWLNRRLHQYYPIISITHHLHIHEQHESYKRSFYHWVERAYLNSVDGFIYNSQTTRQSVEKIIGKTRPHIISSPAGNRFTNQSNTVPKEKSSRLRILFVGNIIPRKGLDTLLTAIAYLDRDCFELHVVGNPEVDPNYMHLIRQLIVAFQLEDNVTITGTIPKEVLMDQYEWADVLVGPSTYEGFGIVYMEAMQFGVPAIASTAGAAKEIITNEENGFLVNPGDIHAINRILKHLHNDRQLLSRMSQAATHYYAQHPSWASSMSRIYTFMQRIIATNKQTTSPNQKTDEESSLSSKRHVKQHL